MTSTAPALAFPGGRVLAGWWRQLAATAPEGLWVGHFLLHRVEALVRLAIRHRPDPFALTLLRAVELTSPATVATLDACLHLGPAVLRRLLLELQSDGLLRAGPDDGWTLTDRGCEAADRGEFSLPARERRVFHFIEPWDPAATRTEQSPQFVAIERPVGTALPELIGWDFDPILLTEALSRPPEWKQRHGFPLEVEEVLTENVANDSQAWQRVILDQREHLVAVFALVRATAADAGASETQVLGFSARPEGWTLDASQASFILRAGWNEVFPNLVLEPPLEAWKQAWKAWCQPRSLPPRDVEACQLERDKHCLRIVAPRSLVDRLRAARSDAFKGEAWLLAGTGSLRTAALIELHEQ